MSSSEGGAGLEPIAAVMVCGHGVCVGRGPLTLDALRPLVARSPRAMLISTGCVHPHGGCPTSSVACGVRLQRCTDDLRPVGPSVAVAGSTGATFRKVAAWLDRSGPR